jgi:hypothetical protein
MVGWKNPPAKAVDTPPSTAAHPPHRIRLEAATEQSSLEAFPTASGAPTGCLPFEDVSRKGRVPIWPGVPRRPSPPAPLLCPSATITRPSPAAASVLRRRRLQHHHRPFVQRRPHAPFAARRGHRYQRSPSKSAGRPASPPGHGPPSSRRPSSSASIAPLQGALARPRCHYRHKRRPDASPKLRILKYSYQKIAELRRTLSRGSSQNPPSTHSGK